jgi:hypothetical protein
MSVHLGAITMNIDFNDLPSPSKLITTMDKHRVGAAFFIVALFLVVLGIVVIAGVLLVQR